jgi:hypothetical protein
MINAVLGRLHQWLDLHASDAAPRATRIPSETARAQYNPECSHCSGGGADVRRDLSRGNQSRHGPQMVSSEGYGRILNAISAVMTDQRFRQGVRPFELHP